MGCTHSKNSKSKSAALKNEHPLERSLHHNRVAHFEETRPTTQSTSAESEEPHLNRYTKNLLNDTKESNHQNATIHDKSGKLKDSASPASTAVGGDQHSSTPIKPQLYDILPKKMESVQHTAVPSTYQQKQFVASTYYPMPTVGEKQKSPEKNKQVKKADYNEEKKKKKELPREKSAMNGPIYRPELTPDDLEYIRRSVQQRNERRAYMMAHRNETDDTLYELEVRMPEKDYTNRIEVTHNSRVY